MRFFNRRTVLALSVTTAISLSLSSSFNAGADEDDAGQAQEFISFNNQIVDAAENNDAAMVSAILNSGGNPNDKGDFNTTALLRAAYHGSKNIVEMLLKKGANPNLADVGGATPLIIASRQGHKDVASLLIKYGAKIDLADKEGNTPLMVASANNSTEVVQLLADAGSNINKTNSHGESALLYAADNKNEKAVKRLMERGADTNVVDEEGSNITNIAQRKANPNLVAAIGVEKLPPSAPAPLEEKNFDLADNHPNKIDWFKDLKNAFPDETGKMELASVTNYQQGTRYIVLDMGNFKTKELAEKRIAELKAKYPELFRNAGLAAVGKEGSYNLNAGVFDNNAEAERICKKLVADGNSCRIVETTLMSKDMFSQISAKAPGGADEKAAAEKKAAEEKLAEEKRAAEEKAIADKKAAEEKLAAEKKAAEEKRLAEEKLAAEKKAAEEKLAAEKKAAEEKRLAEEKKAAEEKIAAEKKAAEEKRLAEEKKAAEEKIAAEKKAAEEKKLAEEKKAAEEKLAADKKAAEEKKLAADKKAAEDKLAAEKKAAEEKLIADKKAAEEKLAADKKAAEEKLAADKKAAEEKIAADKKAAEEKKLTADKKAAEEKFVADKKAAEEKLAADKKAAEEKLAADKKAAEEKKLADDKKAAEEKLAADKKAAEEKLAADKKVSEEKLVAEKKAAEEKKLADEKRIAEEKKLAAEKKAAEVKKLADEKKATEEKLAAEKKAAEAKILAIDTPVARPVEKIEAKALPPASTSPSIVVADGVELPVIKPAEKTLEKPAIKAAEKTAAPAVVAVIPPAPVSKPLEKIAAKPVEKPIATTSVSPQDQTDMRELIGKINQHPPEITKPAEVKSPEAKISEAAKVEISKLEPKRESSYDRLKTLIGSNETKTVDGKSVATSAAVSIPISPKAEAKAEIAPEIKSEVKIEEKREVKITELEQPKIIQKSEPKTALSVDKTSEITVAEKKSEIAKPTAPAANTVKIEAAPPEVRADIAPEKPIQLIDKPASKQVEKTEEKVTEIIPPAESVLAAKPTPKTVKVPAEKESAIAREIPIDQDEVAIRKSARMPEPPLLARNSAKKRQEELQNLAMEELRREPTVSATPITPPKLRAAEPKKEIKLADMQKEIKHLSEPKMAEVRKETKPEIKTEAKTQPKEETAPIVVAAAPAPAVNDKITPAPVEKVMPAALDKPTALDKKVKDLPPISADSATAQEKPAPIIVLTPPKQVETKQVEVKQAESKPAEKAVALEKPPENKVPENKFKVATPIKVNNEAELPPIEVARQEPLPEQPRPVAPTNDKQYWVKVDSFEEQDDVFNFWKKVSSFAASPGAGAIAVQSGSTGKYIAQVGPFGSDTDSTKFCQAIYAYGEDNGQSFRCLKNTVFPNNRTVSRHFSENGLSSGMQRHSDVKFAQTSPVDFDNSGSGVYYIQLGSFSNSGDAQARWEALQAKIKKLNKMEPAIVPSAGKYASGKVYLRTGKFNSHQLADDLCTTLRENSVSCIIVKV